MSRLYVTTPVGVTDQPDFHNAVVALDVPAGPDPAMGALALLTSLKDLERRSGRQPRGRWGPRELDLDLLIFGRAEISIERPPEARSNDAEADPAKATKLLVVPHPEAHERLFVLAPLSDVARWLVPPGWRETVTTARRPSGGRRRRGCRSPDRRLGDAAGRWDARARRQPRRRFGMTSRPKTSMNSVWLRPTLWRWTSS